jgi:hypothetical protein
MRGKRFMIAFVRRVVSFVLALVIAVWLPVRQAGVSERETPLPTREDSAQTDRPSRATDLGLRMVAGTAASQARPDHEALALESWPPRLPDYALWSSVSSARYRLHISPPLRAFPLLI